MKKILILEDDYSIQEFYLSIFSSLLTDQCEIIICSNGQEGLNKYNEIKNSIDAIITDIEMPIMNGIEFLKSIKDEILTKLCPVFIVSGCEKKKLDCIALGFDKFYIKPFSTMQLIDDVAKELKSIVA